MRNIAQIAIALSALAVSLVCAGCRESKSGFLLIEVNRSVDGKSKFPVAISRWKVGTYSAETKSGAGYFYDDVLEYRVWVHPDKGGTPINGEKDYYFAFAQFEPAEAFSQKTKGAEPPLVLIRQKEWINEPKRGQFIPEKGERITEWQVRWLEGSKRNDKSIEEFLKHPVESSTDDGDEDN